MDINEKMIGGVNEIRTGDRTLYECLLLLNSEELNRWYPSIGDPAPWAARNAVITGMKRTYLADGSWTLSITAEVTKQNRILPTVRLNGNDLLAGIEESYDISAVYFPLEWFGCRHATAADCTPFSDAAQTRIPAGKVKYMSTDGTWATPGSILAINATPLVCDATTSQELSNADPGTMDFSRSPFSDPIPEHYMKQSVATRLYRCTFYTKKEMHRISGFCGVNGKFGNHCHAGTGDPGRWLAKSQRLKQVTDLKGNEYTRVERIMIEAPGELHWSAERNGGIWTW